MKADWISKCHLWVQLPLLSSLAVKYPLWGKKGRMKEVFVVLSRGANRLCISPLCPYYLVAVAKWENNAACVCIANGDGGEGISALLILLHEKK